MVGWFCAPVFTRVTLESLRLSAILWLRGENGNTECCHRCCARSDLHFLVVLLTSHSTIDCCLDNLPLKLYIESSEQLIFIKALSFFFFNNISKVSHNSNVYFGCCKVIKIENLILADHQGINYKFPCVF